MILFGHPTGNPNSHNAALAHYESGRLEAFCVPWFPANRTLKALGTVPGLDAYVARLQRRRFEPLASASKLQGRLGEWRRMAARVTGAGDERLSYLGNDWLMGAMAQACRRSSVTAVHSYEDCSLWQFQQASRTGKRCIYDMPIGYYPWWEDKHKQLARDYAVWVPSGGVPSSRYVRPEQKVKEMELADLVLVACTFVEKTIREFYPQKRVALAPYGVDSEFWCPAGGAEDSTKRHTREKSVCEKSDKITFIYAGQSSIRKGTPMLLDAWEKAQLRNAELVLVGSWQLAAGRLKRLPAGARFVGPVGPEELRGFYRESDAFVFPSFFEGFGLVLLEAMACGLPAIATECSAGPDFLDDSCGRVVKAGDLEHLVETLRWFDRNRDTLPAMKRAARSKAESFSWKKYRAAVSGAVGPFL